LPFIPPPFDVPDVRLIRRDSGALPLELFTLPFEESVVPASYEFVTVDGFVKVPMLHGPGTFFTGPFEKSGFLIFVGFVMRDFPE